MRASSQSPSVFGFLLTHFSTFWIPCVNNRGIQEQRCRKRQDNAPEKAQHLWMMKKAGD
jgi:hypothetical protein